MVLGILSGSIVSVFAASWPGIGWIKKNEPIKTEELRNSFLFLNDRFRTLRRQADEWIKGTEKISCKTWRRNSTNSGQWIETECDLD
jgi:hypothetical protein